MKNLLESTGIATIFLDRQLNVRRFTESATKLVRLIPGDVGRPVTDLVSELVYDEFTQDARQVLASGKSVEKSIQTRGGRWYLLRMMRGSTEGGAADGVVITFMDITNSKELERKLRDAQSDLKAHLAEKEKAKENVR